MSFSGRVQIQDVLPYVPHKPPMVWVDEIIASDASSGECAVRMRSDALFWGPEGLRKSSCLEFIAQAYGFASVAYDHRIDLNAKPLKRTFLAQFKDATFASAARFAAVRPGDEIHVRYSGVRKIGSIIMFAGQASHNGDLLAQAQLKVFCES